MLIFKYMNKNIVLGIAAFGGLILVGVLLKDKPKDTAVTQEITQEVAEIKLPTDIPTFPIYPGSKVVTVNDVEGESARDISVRLEVKATKNEVYDWYRKEFSLTSWKIKSDKNVGGYQIIQAEKDNLYTSLQTANADVPDFVIISQNLKIRK